MKINLDNIIMISIVFFMISLSAFSVDNLENGSSFYTIKLHDLRCRLRVASFQELKERHRLFKNQKDQINAERLRFYMSKKKVDFGFSTKRYRFSINDTSK